MIKTVVGLMAALLLAACAAPPAPTPVASAGAYAGHPTPDYPGPRLY